MIEVDPADPAFADPTKPIGPIYTAEEARQLGRRRRAGRSGPTATHMRRVVPSPAPKRIFEIRQIRLAARAGLRRHLRRRRRHPDRATSADGTLRRRRGRHRQGPRQRPAGPRHRRRRLRDGDRHRRGATSGFGTPEQRPIARGPPRRAAAPSTATSSPRARCCRRSTAACDFARATGQRRGHRPLADIEGSGRRHGRHPDRHRRRRRRTATDPNGRRRTDMALGVHSEVGKLRRVMVHRPGLEHTRLTPSNAEELLFDDVLWVAPGQAGARRVLRGRCATAASRCFEAETLLAEALASADARDWVDRAHPQRAPGRHRRGGRGP